MTLFFTAWAHVIRQLVEQSGNISIWQATWVIPLSLTSPQSLLLHASLRPPPISPTAVGAAWSRGCTWAPKCAAMLSLRRPSHGRSWSPLPCLPAMGSLASSSLPVSPAGWAQFRCSRIWHKGTQKSSSGFGKEVCRIRSWNCFRYLFKFFSCIW
jgi:hypothetical protein